MIACGFTFTISQSDIVPLLRQLIEEFYIAMSYNDVTDWLGPNWQDGLGVYNSYLGMNPGLFEAGRQFVTWAQNNNKLPSTGSVSTPSNQVLSGGKFFPDISVTLGSLSFSTSDPYYINPFYSELLTW